MNISKHIPCRNALMGAFLAVSAAGLSGCGTTQQLGACMKPTGFNLGVVSKSGAEYDKVCAGDMSARAMLSGDTYTRAVGMSALSESQPAIKKGLQSTLRAVANQREDVYIGRYLPDGTYKLEGAPVVTAPALPEAANPNKQPEAKAQPQPAGPQ